MSSYKICYVYTALMPMRTPAEVSAEFDGRKCIPVTKTKVKSHVECLAQRGNTSISVLVICLVQR